MEKGREITLLALLARVTGFRSYRSDQIMYGVSNR